MRAKKISWWQKIKKPLIVVLIIIAFVLVVWLIVAITSGYLTQNWDWTGFKKGTSQITITSTSKTNYSVSVDQPYKTLWDWLQLLGILAIPVVVGLGTVLFTTQQANESEKNREKRHQTDLEIAEKNRVLQQQTDLQIAVDNQREVALQTYINIVSELLLKEHLGERTADGKLKPEYEHVCKIARIRTITVLTQLDVRRIGYVFTFLRDVGLMSTTHDEDAVSLRSADLRAVNWSQVNLRYANLREANFSEANLQEANLSGANLRLANLSGANLSGAIFSSRSYVPRAFGGTIVIPNRADLSGADLSGANLRGAQGITNKELEEQAQSLKGATMPNGSLHD